MSTWTKQPSLGCGHSRGCGTCPPLPENLPMDELLCVGFGQVTATKGGGEVIWQGDDWDKPVADIEAQAAADSDHDWRLHFYAPLSERTYQRHGPEEWVLVEKGMGFA